MRALVIRLAVGAFVLSTPAAGQTTEASDTAAQRVCAGYVATITNNNGLATPTLANARTGIRGCEVSGPPVIARLWSFAGNNVAELNRLLSLAEQLRDRRILDTLVLVARRQTAPEPVRIAALSALTGYFSPNRTFGSVNELRLQVFGNPLSRAMHYDTLSGSVPLPANAQSTIATVFRDLAKTDPVPSVRQAARFLRQATYYIAPTITPINTNASTVSLVYVCANRFLLRNFLDIAVEIRLDVVGTTETRKIYPEAAPTTSPGYSEMKFNTKNQGTVKAYFNQQLLATRANANTPC